MALILVFLPKIGNFFPFFTLIWLPWRHMESTLGTRLLYSMGSSQTSQQYHSQSPRYPCPAAERVTRTLGTRLTSQLLIVRTHAHRAPFCTGIAVLKVHGYTSSSCMVSNKTKWNRIRTCKRYLKHTPYATFFPRYFVSRRFRSKNSLHANLMSRVQC